MKKQVMMLGLSVLPCGCGGKSVEREDAGTYTNDSGEKTVARVKLKNDRIAEIEIDKTARGKDKTKKEPGEDYGMKQASPIKKEWNEQITLFEKYVEKHGIDKIKFDQNDRAENNDVRSSCTINVDGFIKTIQDAEKNAKQVTGYLRAVKQPMQIFLLLSDGVSFCAFSRERSAKHFLSGII